MLKRNVIFMMGRHSPVIRGYVWRKRTCQENYNTSYFCVDILMQIQLYYFVSHRNQYISTCVTRSFWIVKMKTKPRQVENLYCSLHNSAVTQGFLNHLNLFLWNVKKFNSFIKVVLWYKMTWKSCQEELSKLRIDLPWKEELLLKDWFGHIVIFNF